MVNTQPPPIKEAGYPMNLGHDNVGWVAAGGNIFRLVFEADSRETVVGSPAIGSNRCSRAHSRLDERNEALGGCVLDTRHADTTGAPTPDFGGNRDNRFLVCFPPRNANLPAAHIGFVDLDLAIQKLSARSNHGPAQLMEPCPSRLITAQAEYSLNPKRTDAVLLIRHIPHRLEPKPQRFPRTLEDRPRGRRRLTLASRTSLLAPGRHPRLGSPAGRTPKPGRPTDTPKKIRTGGLRSEPVVKFHKRARVIDPANGMGSILGHHNILPLRERIGYPIPEIAKARQQGLIPAATQQTAAALPHVADQLAGGGQKQVATRAASPTKAVPSLTQQAVAVDATPPTLEINDSVETVGPVVTIEGLVSDQSGIAELSVQGVPVPVGADGRFSIRRGVPVGESEITVAAVDVWGNVAQRQVKVSRTLPQPQAPKVVATTTTATVDKTPPVIETIAGLKTNLEIETISGRVTDASKIASFTIEGKAVALDANGAFSIERKLPIGESHVRMAAVDRFGNQAETVVTILRRPHIPKINYGNYHALIIGNADYQELPKLKTAVVDAKAVAKILEEEYGFEVRLLTDVTRNDMIDAFDELREELGENDNLLVYYAGHGWLDEASGRGYWQPVNAQLNRRSQWMSNATLTDSLKALKAKHVMVVADSCYSGVLTRSIKVPDRTIDYIERMASRRTRVVLTSGGLEPVLDSGGGKHSVFAAEFLKVLENNTAVLDGTQLFERVRRPVVLAAPQTPQYSDIRFSGHDGGDFLFVRKY